MNQRMNPVRPTRVIGGRYVVLGELGRGGMGIVWRAEDRVMGRQVAVKELHLPAGLSPEERRLFRERLLREARTAGRLNAPGIVTVHDVITDSGVDHIVMELIEARTLADVVAAEGPLDERRATAVAKELLAALLTAHENGVVHRDVKPSNVMLGPGDRVKLTDFGIAQAADDPRLTTTGAVPGSPSYLAPERFEGREATPASDLWSLGVTLYFAVNGGSPFTRETTAATIAAVLHAEVPPVRTRGALGAVIAGLLQRNPQARLSSAHATALLGGDGGLPGPVGATAPEAPRKRRWVLPAAALVVGLVVGIVLARGGGGAAAGARATIMTYGGELPSISTVNTCLNGPLVDGAVYPSGTAEDCASPHALEVFHTVDFFDSERTVAYPGVAELGAAASAACELVFDSDVIVGPDKDRLEVIALIPSKETFEHPKTDDSLPSRQVVCLLRAADRTTQLTGSRISTAGS